ncbi:hypothetical protein B0H14DRAFT_3140292, partial [Mycena olivaceomarginata]
MRTTPSQSLRRTWQVTSKVYNTYNILHVTRAWAGVAQDKSRGTTKEAVARKARDGTRWRAVGREKGRENDARAGCNVDIFTDGRVWTTLAQLMNKRAETTDHRAGLRLREGAKTLHAELGVAFEEITCSPIIVSAETLRSLEPGRGHAIRRHHKQEPAALRRRGDALSHLHPSPRALALGPDPRPTYVPSPSSAVPPSPSASPPRLDAPPRARDTPPRTAQTIFIPVRSTGRLSSPLALLTPSYLRRTTSTARTRAPSPSDSVEGGRAPSRAPTQLSPFPATFAASTSSGAFSPRPSLPSSGRRRPPISRDTDTSAQRADGIYQEQHRGLRRTTSPRAPHPCRTTPSPVPCLLYQRHGRLSSTLHLRTHAACPSPNPKMRSACMPHAHAHAQAPRSRPRPPARARTPECRSQTWRRIESHHIARIAITSTSLARPRSDTDSGHSPRPRPAHRATSAHCASHQYYLPASPSGAESHRAAGRKEKGNDRGRQAGTESVASAVEEWDNGTTHPLGTTDSQSEHAGVMVTGTHRVARQGPGGRTVWMRRIGDRNGIEERGLQVEAILGAGQKSTGVARAPARLLVSSCLHMPYDETPNRGLRAR